MGFSEGRFRKNDPESVFRGHARSPSLGLVSFVLDVLLGTLLESVL